MFRDVGCVQSEDVGAQKLHSDGKSQGISQETMDEASGLQNKSKFTLFTISNECG